MSLPDAWVPAVEGFATAALSAPIALMRLLLAGAGEDLPARLAAAARDRPELAPLATLAEAERDRLPGLIALVERGLLPSGTAAVRRHFDRLAETLPDAGVALYTFGDPMLIAQATAELIAVIEAMAPVDGRDLLDFGCGTGRLARALADRARHITALDVSPAMIAEARRRGGAVAYHVGDGTSLAPLPDRSVDLAIASDSLPFVVAGGAEQLDRLFAEFARVLRPGGDLLLFNWSYRGDLDQDRREAQALARAHRFDLLAAGEPVFRLWDAAAFHLRRRR